jgi:hypothetical protein
MSGYFNNLSQQLFNKPLHSCTVEEVENLAHNYPYFAPAQFLLLKKLDAQSEEYGRQYQRSILYYKNPLEFDYFIQNEHYITQFEEAEKEETFLVKEFEENTEEISIAEEINTVENFTEEKVDVLQEDIPTLIKKEEKAEAKITEGPAEMTFEPFHAVDYFASQGIKLSQEEATNDRIGKQLKSFTEWLKTMKRIPPKDLQNKVPEEGVEKVVNLAEHSVKNPEVVTEAMAEVWVKQGNSEKAVEVYDKLSLLNPSKRAYFAAKIDHLKKAN